MYNRYIPQEIQSSSGENTPPMEGKAPFHWKQLLKGGGTAPLRDLLPLGEGDPLDGLLKSLKLDGVDSGDILLVLLILFLLIEGDDQWELIITLGLLLIMGLAEGDD